MSIPVVEVKLWGDRVGAVAQNPVTGFYSFAYDPQWVKKGIEISPLHMPIEQYRRHQPFEFTNLGQETYRGMPAAIADSLPDAFGNALIDSWMADKGVPKSSISPLDRLCYMGTRGMGALEFHPIEKRLPRSEAAIELRNLVEGARRALSGDFSGDREAQAAVANIIQMGTSAGGARPKAVIAYNHATKEIRSGQFRIEKPFTHCLLKLDGVGKNNVLGNGSEEGRVEYAYYLMAEAAGLYIQPSMLLEENGRSHFMTLRFDRDMNTKHHIQTLCAMDHLDYKMLGTHGYSQYLQAIRNLGMSDADVLQGITRMVFNVVTSNCDDHSKNFSFLLKQGSKWELAPAYDLTHAYDPAGKWTYQHFLSVNGKFKDIQYADIMATAATAGIYYCKDIIEKVVSAARNWKKFAREADVSEHRAKLVEQDFTFLEIPGAHRGSKKSVRQ